MVDDKRPPPPKVSIVGGHSYVGKNYSVNLKENIGVSDKIKGVATPTGGGSSRTFSSGQSEAEKGLEHEGITSKNVSSTQYGGLSEQGKASLISGGYQPSQSSSQPGFAEVYEGEKGIKDLRKEAEWQLKHEGITYEKIITSEKPQQEFGNLSSNAQDIILGQEKESTEKGNIFVSSDKSVLGTEFIQGSTQYFLNLNETVGVGAGLGGERNAAYPTTRVGGSIVPTALIGSETLGRLKTKEKEQNIKSEKEFRDMFTQGQKGNAFFIFYGKDNKILGASGSDHAYHDYLATQKQYGGDVFVQTTYPRTEAALVGAVKQNPEYFAKLPNSFYEQAGKSGNLTEKGMREINLSIRGYYKEKNAPIIAQDKALRQEINRWTESGAQTYIYNKKGDLVKTTGGKRAYHDYRESLKTFGEGTSVAPHYSHTPQAMFERVGKAGATSPQGGSVEFLKEFGKSAVSTGASMVASGYSAVAFAAKKNNNDIVSFLTKPQPEFAANVAHSIVPVSFGKLTQGKIEGRQPPITHSAERAVKPYMFNTTLGGAMGGGKFPNTRAGIAGSLAFQIYMVGEGGRFLSKGVPLRYEKFPEITTTGGKTIAQQKGIVLGYGGEGSRQIIGSAGGKFKVGEPTFSEMRPKGSEAVISNPQRGTEIATRSGYQSAKLSSPGYWERVTEIGASSRGDVEAKLVTDVKTMNEVLINPKTNIQRSNIFETNREGISETIVKTGLESVGKQQPASNLLNPITLLTKGTAGKIQGSTSTAQFLSEDLLGQMRKVAPEHDIDVIKSNPLGILEETQAKNLAKQTFGRISGEKHVAPSLKNIFPGLTASQSNKLLVGQVKTSESLSSFGGKELSLEGRRIYEGSEKAIEYVTRKEETSGSGAKKSGLVFGKSINTTTFKSSPKGSNISVKHTSGIFQAQTNIAKMGIQSGKSAAEQNATPEQLKIIGKGEYFGPELFAGKAITRTYFQTLGTSRELLKNPATKKQGLAGIAAVHRTRYYQFDNPKTALYNWEESTTSGLKESESSSLISSRSSGIGSSKLLSGFGLSSSKSSQITSQNKSAISQLSVKSNLSLSSQKSALSGFSAKSLLSGKSGFSSKSGLYGKSGKYNLSIKSGLSSFSGLYGKSSKSGISGRSAVSGKSGLSGFSGKSGVSGKSGLSGFSSYSLRFTTNPPPALLTPIGGNIGVRKNYKQPDKYTRIFKWNVKNPFSSSLNITEK